MASSVNAPLTPAADPIPATEAPSSKPSEASVERTICPRCQSKLTNPEGLGWCSRCGYCRSLEEEKPVAAPLPTEQPATSKKPSALGALEFVEAVKVLPDWLWPLLGGVGGVMAASIVTDQYLPEE